MSLSATDLINNFEMYFDGTDMTNASLYLCIDSAVGDNGAQTIIESMRNTGLWSGDAAKTVPAEHKPMYAEQMKFIGYVSGRKVSLQCRTLGRVAGFYRRKLLVVYC